MPVRARFVVLLIAGMISNAAFTTLVSSAQTGDPSPNSLEPELLTAKIYDPASTNLLFTFRRTATNSGTTLRVAREFLRPDGSVAARERVVYRNGKLQSFTLEDFQKQFFGTAVVQSNSANSRLEILFNCTSGGTRKSNREKLEPDTLNSDMVGVFIASHWSELEKGAVLRCRMMAIPRAETVGFKFYKESDITWQTKPAAVIRMEPSSFIIARLLKPLRFVVEKDPAHRVLQYFGRTTPSIQRKGRWDDLDALTVFDWN